MVPPDPAGPESSVPAVLTSLTPPTLDVIYSIERWRISEYLMIRDTSCIPNILWFEYVTIRGEVITRKKASARKNN